jgi:PAS domain S-box-containing protein
VDATRSLHESLIEMLPDAVLALDVELGRFAIANLAAERLLGLTRAQLARLSLRDLVRPWEVAQLERVEATLRTQGAWRGELWLKRQDGTFVPTDVAAQAWNQDGRTLFQLCCRDASERWRDSALRQVVSHAAERLASTVDHREALRTVVTAALPGLADAALVELDAVDDDEPEAVAAFADPAAPNWPAVQVDETPSSTTRDAIRRGATLAVPLLANAQRIGTLTLRRNPYRSWDPGDQPFVEQLAGHAAHAIHQARQSSGARQELSQRAAMLRILSLVNTDATPRQVYETMLEEAQIVLQADDGGAARWDLDRGLLCPAFPTPGVKTHCVVDRRLMVWMAAAERHALIENEYQQKLGKDTPAGRVGARAVLAVPMVHNDSLVGSASISHFQEGRRFGRRDARRFEALASAAATVISGMQRQQRTGARMAMREAAHLLNNDLTVTMGSLDVIRTADDLPPALGSLVDTALDGVAQAAAHLAQLQSLTRVEAYCSPVGPSLDLIASMAQAESA